MNLIHRAQMWALMRLTGEAVTAEDPNTWIDTILAPIEQYLTISNLLIFIGAALGFGVVFFLFWWGYRFIVRKATGAIKKGKIG